MSKPVQFRAIAAAELDEAWEWYDDRRIGLGDELLLCVEAVVDAISRQPEMYPVVENGIRRALTRRFPYAIFYLDEPEHVVVLAVFHVSRDPHEWRDRQ